MAGADHGRVAFGPDQGHDTYLAWIGSIPAGDGGPSPHLHPHSDEAFYVAAGEATFQLGDRNVVAPAGSFIFVPRGVARTVWNPGNGPVRDIFLFSPGEAEHSFQPVGAAK